MAGCMSDSITTCEPTWCSRQDLRIEVNGDELEVPVDGSEVRHQRHLRSNAVAMMVPRPGSAIKGRKGVFLQPQRSGSAAGRAADRPPMCSQLPLGPLRNLGSCLLRSLLAGALLRRTRLCRLPPGCRPASRLCPIVQDVGLGKHLLPGVRLLLLSVHEPFRR